MERQHDRLLRVLDRPGPHPHLQEEEAEHQRHQHPDRPPVPVEDAGQHRQGDDQDPLDAGHRPVGELDRGRHREVR